MNRSDARILVVDDSPSMRMCLCYLLRQLGFLQLDEATNGVEALTLYARTPYDLVITDWYMPHLDGVELLSAIRNGAERNRTPVLLLTGSVTHAKLHEAIDAGATGFVPKPFFNPALTEQVLAVIAGTPAYEGFEDIEPFEPMQTH